MATSDEEMEEIAPIPETSGAQMPLKRRLAQEIVDPDTKT
jgi:hypothetical protein